VIARSLQAVPIFDVLTRQDGLVLPSFEEQREEEILRVEDAMKAAPELILDADAALEDVSARTSDLPVGSFLVRMSPSGWSAISRDLLNRMMKEGKGALTLGSVLPIQRLPYLYPDLPLDAALRCVNQAEVIPVVNRADLRKLEGIVTRDDVLSRYQADHLPE
jgi:chloride channel protein, CIC family